MTDAPTFEDLIRRVRAWDQEAATELVRRYEPAIRRAVRFRLADARLGGVLDSMDICQSVLASFFVRAASGQYDLETPEKVLGLLAAMARNKLASQARRAGAQRRGGQRVRSGGGSQEDYASLVPSPSREVDARDLLQQVRVRLAPDEIQILELRNDGHDWAVIAARLGGGAEALRKRLLALLLTHQSRAWRRGERPLVEDYLTQQPRLWDDSETVLDLIYNEILLHEEVGESPTLDDYLRRFPALAPQLVLQFEVEGALGPLALMRTLDGATLRAGDATPAAAPVMPAIPGHELLGELGRGGMRVVYKARQVRLNRVKDAIHHRGRAERRTPRPRLVRSFPTLIRASDA